MRAFGLYPHHRFLSISGLSCCCCVWYYPTNTLRLFLFPVLYSLSLLYTRLHFLGYLQYDFYSFQKRFIIDKPNKANIFLWRPW